MKSEKEFSEFAYTVLKSITSKLEEKGEQYTDGTDALSNFTRGSEETNLYPAHYLMVMANKHWHSLVLWASKKVNQSTEDVVERCTDIIVYMLLLMFMKTTNRD